jgi:hypothetical protein
VWAGIVVVALPASYVADPYIYGLTTFVLAGGTTMIALVGLPASLIFKTTRFRARLSIMLFLAVAIIAISLALAILRTFKWA